MKHVDTSPEVILSFALKTLNGETRLERELAASHLYLAATNGNLKGAPMDTTEEQVLLELQERTTTEEAAAADASPPESYVDDEEPAVSAPWTVQSLEDADWALKRIGDLEREVAENERVYQSALLRLKLRHGVLTERADRGIAFFTAKLEAYAAEHRAELIKGKKKSRTLLHGSLGFRKSGGGLEVLDKEALLGWCRQQPVESEVLRITEAPAIAAVQKHFKDTGEVPPGTELKPEVENFTLSTTGIK